MTYAYSSSSSNDGFDSFDESFSPSLINENHRNATSSKNLPDSSLTNIRDSPPKNVRTSFVGGQHLNLILTSQQSDSSSPLLRRTLPCSERFLIIVINSVFNYDLITSKSCSFIGNKFLSRISESQIYRSKYQ